MKSNNISVEDFLSGKGQDAARAYAVNEAQKATYRDFNDFSNFVSSLGKNRSKNKVAKFTNVIVEGTLPFKRTPANILARGIEYSPVGLANGIKDAVINVKSGKVTATEAIDKIASGLTGTGIVALGVLLAKSGLVSGGDKDDKQDEFDKLQGGQNYALSVGGKNYTLDWLAPESLPFFVGVELFNRISDIGNGDMQAKDIYEALSNVANPMLEMSMLQGIDDVLTSVSYSDNKLFSVLASSVLSYLGQFFPTILGQAERTVSGPQRETAFTDRNSQIPNDIQYFLGQTANKIPGVDFNQIPFVDAWGRTQNTGNVSERAANNFVNPSYVSQNRTTFVDTELQRLKDAGHDSVFPSKPSQSTKIDGRYLTPDEYVSFSEEKGQTSYETISTLIKKPSMERYGRRDEGEGRRVCV